MLNSVSELYRIYNFNSKVQADISQQYIKTLVNKYVDGLDEKSIYDDIVKINKYLDSNSIDITELRDIKPELREYELIDYVRYKVYYTKLSDRDIAKSLLYNINEDDEVTVNNIIYRWNRRKNYFTELDRGLSFINAIPIIQSRTSKNCISVEGKELVFGFIEEKIFFVVEINNKDVIRIISFRRSCEYEFDKLMRGSL